MGKARKRIKPALKPTAMAMSPAQLHRKLTWRRWSFSITALLVLVTLSLLDHRGWFLYDGGDVRRFDGCRFDVVRIIDGDTIEVASAHSRAGDETVHVRLWGIDCPEIAHPEYGRMADDPWGPQATALTREMCQGQTVTLSLESHRPRDDFERVLAYVVLTDGSVLNERLLSAGLARADERPGDPRFMHRHTKRYRLLEQQARLDKAGLWSGNPGGILQKNTDEEQPAAQGVE